MIETSWTDPPHAPPKIRLPKDRCQQSYVSYVLYDIDAPYPHDRSNSPYLHYGRLNVPCKREVAATVPSELLAYQPPSPPGGIAHCYKVVVLGHEEKVDVASERGRVGGRGRWDVGAFMRRNKMVQLHTVSYMNAGDVRRNKNNARGA